MTLEYKIEEQDFLAFQLFTASKSERIHKKKRNAWVLLTVGSIVIAFFFYLNQNNPMSLYFGLVAITTGIFYPKYFSWRYKKHYKTHIKENYLKRFGQVETLEISQESISSKNKIGEGKINLSEIEKIDETNKHFFLKISTGLSLIIPKQELADSNGLRERFKEIGLSVNDELSWKWE